MRLVDLDPRWTAANAAIYSREEHEGMAHSFCGITFLCPHCVGQDKQVFLGVPFANPINGIDKLAGQTNYWNREGETFGDLSITPSINAEAHGHWHGFITKGEIK